ncbi:alsin homolog [Condylostylus longicornis]|uniref:alsin homolog n=1 Tax=Condylostylus longicornis TaxID=2530218 RepID=UPI00244DE8A5|nr:alsin homolog [Condylostylus longicornis]
MSHLKFQIFYNGESINCNIENLFEIGPILRFYISENLAFLLSNNNKLFHGIYNPNTLNLSLKLWKEGVIDIDLYNNIFYLVLNSGCVYKKKIFPDNLTFLSENNWEEIKFLTNFNNHSLENVIKVVKVKSNSIGTLYMTSDNEIYGQGQCGEVLTTENPTKLGMFFENQKIIDIACGDNFFIVLTQKYLSDFDDLEEFKIQKYVTLKNFNKTKRKNYLRRMDTVVEMFSNNINSSNKNNGYESEANSSASSNDSTNFEDSIYFKIQEILKNGYSLINTSVCSFGTKNESLLGTGDHIKRQGVHPVLYLNSIGCYNISCGKEHSICRTLDGRIFHWGLNTNLQQTNDNEEKDITAPKELHLESFSNVLEGYCEGYRTILCNNEVKIFQQPSYNEQNESLEKKIFNLHSFAEKRFPIMLICNKFTLLNSITLEVEYQTFFSSMQATVRAMLRNQIYLKNFQKLQAVTTHLNIKSIFPLIRAYNRMLYAFAACLQTVEDFYRKNIEYKDLLFLCNSQELIDIFDDYTRHYCDIKSINGFADFTKQFPYIKQKDNREYEKIFAAPFEQISNILQFCELLSRNEYISTLQISNFFNEKNSEWQEFSKKQIIEVEIAENTEQFWLKNVKISQIRPFKKRYRRVILDSMNLPLKLSTSSAFSSNSFILFSDCLCQYGSQLQMFPLIALWVQVDGDTNLRIHTPEKSFLLIARSRDDKMIWHDQMKQAILKALGKPGGSQLTNTRSTMYTFSDKHPVYSKVKAYGKWILGVMHGLFYLEYPDGKIYFGEIKNNEIDGFGKMIIPSSGIYEGNFKAGKFNGIGNYEMKDNAFYEGNFKDGLFHGHGTLKASNYTYIGEFCNNMKNGYGIQDDLITGDKYMGMFAENRKTGGVCVTLNGDYFEGFFVNDDIVGEGLSIFNNGNYYEGHMTLKGPDGKGIYYIPIKEVQETSTSEKEIFVEGNIISGNLGGTWSDVRVISGNVNLNKKFPKTPKSIGERVVDNNRKWRSLFDNWEEVVLGNSSSSELPKLVWSRVAVYITSQKEREKVKEQNVLDSFSSFFAKNITLELNKSDMFLSKLSNSLDKISVNSAMSTLSKRNTAEKSIHYQHKRSYSNEILFDKIEKFDQEFDRYYEENVNLNNFFSMHQFDSISNQSNSSSNRSSLEGKINPNSNIIALDIVPDFGINSLNKEDIKNIKDYLEQAFKDQYHPLNMLNNRISNSFYSSYGCWRMKPTPILAYQAIKEWESISLRVYKIIRKLFPALPADRCDIEESGEVVSHFSLLYPILLSEGIYSTLCVLYANKYREQDEIYRQRIMLIEKTGDEELLDFLCFEKTLINIIRNGKFNQAIVTLKQITEECSPKGMLDILEKSIELINDALKQASECAVIPDGGADNIVPLTLYLVLRANVPHLGAELALLDDLTGEANHEMNLSGLAGYCFTTIKAAYEHIVKGNLFDVLEQNYFLSHRKF